MTKEDKITVDEAFNRLLTAFTAPQARELLDTALRIERVHLWDNQKVDPIDSNFIATHLRVATRLASDGRWHAGIEPTRAIEPGPWVWMVSRDQVELLLQEPKRGAGGAPRSFDHDEIRLRAIILILKNAFPDIKEDWRRVLSRGLPRDKQGEATLAKLQQEVEGDFGNKSPGETLLKQVLGPLHKGLKSQSD
jgi:hypothetical protein